MMKRWLLLLLVGVLLLSCVACAPSGEEAPEALQQNLATLSDEELIEILIKNYETYQEPAVFAAEMSCLLTVADVSALKMTGTVRSTGADRKLNLTLKTVAGTVETAAVYHNGMLYLDVGGVKTKYDCREDETLAQEQIKEWYPVFVTLQEGNFGRRDLLRSDNGTYTLVFSAPADNMGATLPETGEDGVEILSLSDSYLTLFFSSEGKLLGQTFGTDMKVNSDGIETEAEYTVKFLITSTDPVQNPISVPDDAEEYTFSELLPETSTDEEQNRTSSEKEEETEDDE